LVAPDTGHPVSVTQIGLPLDAAVVAWYAAI